VFPVDVLR